MLFIPRTLFCITFEIEVILFSPNFEAVSFEGELNELVLVENDVCGIGIVDVIRDDVLFMVPGRCPRHIESRESFPTHTELFPRHIESFPTHIESLESFPFGVRDVVR